MYAVIVIIARCCLVLCINHQRQIKDSKEQIIHFKKTVKNLPRYFCV